MKCMLTIFLLVLSTSAVAKEEIWECYYPSGNIQGVYRLNTNVPSIAIFDNGKWIYLKNIVYDKENQNLNDSDINTWDLLLKRYTKLMDSDKDCKVIDP